MNTIFNVLLCSLQDEIQDFVSTCIINPPGPRKVANYLMKRAGGGQGSKKHGERKRKHKDPKPDKGPPRKGIFLFIHFHFETFVNNKKNVFFL